jgi:hypothetical protein
MFRYNYAFPNKAAAQNYVEDELRRYPYEGYSTSLLVHAQPNEFGQWIVTGHRAVSCD